MTTHQSTTGPSIMNTIADDWFRRRREQLRNLGAHLREHIKGQAHVIGRVESVLRRGELGLAHPGRPKGSFLFVGPTGQATHCTLCCVECGS